MSHGALNLGGPSFYRATTTSSSIRGSSSQCRISGWAPHAHGRRGRKLLVCSVPDVSSLYRRSLTASGRQCSDGFGTEKLSRKSVGFRVVCQVQGGGRRNLTVEDWTRKLPAKRKALYSHSLPCIEAWLQSLGFVQGKDDRAIWNIERPDWHAQISLDVTDLHVRYLRKGPGNLERDVERKFSYALSREDLENAILGGP